MRREKKEELNRSAASAVVAVVFLVLGFQIAVFVTKVLDRPAVAEMPAEEDTEVSKADSASIAFPRDTAVTAKVRAKPAWRGYPRPERPYGGGNTGKSSIVRKIESFPFDPNTVTVEDLVRLGLSRRQAEVVENYRTKGGSFRRKSDFKKMYVISDTLYDRLEPYIDIPLLELNCADSSALLSLNGIGPFYAGRILEYRRALGGFVNKEKLREIRGMDSSRFASLAEQVRVDSTLAKELDIWHSTEERLAAHPYLGARRARAVMRFKSVYDSTCWTVGKLREENVLSDDRIFLYLHR